MHSAVTFVHVTYQFAFSIRVMLLGRVLTKACNNYRNSAGLPLLCLTICMAGKWRIPTAVTLSVTIQFTNHLWPSVCSVHLAST